MPTTAHGSRRNLPKMVTKNSDYKENLLLHLLQVRIVLQYTTAIISFNICITLCKYINYTFDVSLSCR